MSKELIKIPAKLWSVVPPIWNAATPVLAVATVDSGGKELIIFLKR